MALSIPSPDPHPRIVSPVAELSDETAEAIFATFPDATGFYLLINGLLQLMVPDHFDYETKLPALPRSFGGLKVSFIAQSLYPTANSTVTATSVTSGEQKEAGIAVSQQPLATRYDSVTNAFRSLHGGTVRAIVDSSRDKDRRFDGRIGVFVSPHFDPTQLYATAPTHNFTDAVAASKTISLNSGDWTRAIRPTLVPTGKYQLGEIARVYDPSPQTFPLGFAHDISLVKVTQVHMPLTTTPTTTTPSLTWMDRREWADIKYNSRNLALLQSGHDVEEAKSIGIVESRCQMVGQGIFRLQQQSRRRRLFGSSGIPNNGASRDELDGWTSLVARSILFRVRQDGAGAPRGSTTKSGDAWQSGTPVCVVREDGTLSGIIKIAGFASFAQPVSDVQRYELEGDKLYKRLQEGRVAFYGAFQIPTELREGYKIV
ncbi:hypothetical protein B0T18DRAFT_408194 [Schizothecium vesticola]|uniref:Uncharacterized protein n=1 Tax=Schizothecium vesticola TaxID=314040 RepID=A0AA40F2P3_9PEZI|nr:hypothetical protein B0T18DRAFT_408194 [Schizothecium vesticola]